MTSPEWIRDILIRAADEALARLEARYMGDPAEEAFLSRMHAAEHPTPALRPTTRPETVFEQTIRIALHERKLRQRVQRARTKARAASRAALARPGNAALEACAADAWRRVDVEQREAQEELARTDWRQPIRYPVPGSAASEIDRLRLLIASDPKNRRALETRIEQLNEFVQDARELVPPG